MGRMPERWERLLLEPVRNRIVVNARDGSVLVYVPGGEFEMGSAAGEGFDNERPRHWVELSGYWIGVYAVTNAQYLKFVQATGHRPPEHADYGEPEWKAGRFPAERADHPVVCVSWDDAVAYANWAGCGLASEAQWEKACRGPLGLAYPWGNEWDESRCRNDKNRGSETTSAVQGYPRGVSGYGTYNQSGNVSEWCADWYDEKYYGGSPRKDPGGPAGGSVRVLRGGGWGGGGPGGFRAANRRLDPGDRNDNQGLRLVRMAS
ncbi:SUMF1/EgtB/PvdO family nonheme iron enzyme [Accumulibacter sp.]|uniref:formylglycine-generating enzyme family protein n=1 Tax=Accumulibacter sp. TaxID=2053492 RepID=UPI0025F06A9A|nr:SUMF1/EgtB/PvdO family nonheme iron enzyme [Accumulibacter sp.]MCM8626277.1 formylglycine-generating enzyme family protein [Accumulibacter sp.]